MPSYKLDIIVNAKDNASMVLGRLGSTLGGLGRIAGIGFGVAAAAAVGAGVVITKVTKDAINVAKDFESQMSILGIAAKSSGISFDGLEAAALKVGGDVSLLGVSASGAADSMTGLFKAGLTATEIFGDLEGYMAGTAELGGALRASIDLAAATELDMVQASELAAIALATFGGELETEAERAEFVNMAMNNMVKAADASVAEVSDLAAALSTIGPTAAAFGFSFEEMNNALALLSTRGIKGAEAGTALKSMLTNMQRPTAKTVGAMQELGISLYDSEGNMHSLSNIIKQFTTSMAGMTEEQRNAYVQQIAGTYGMKALQTLMAEGTEGWDAMAEATANAAGINEQAASKSDDLAFAQEALAGALETVKITAANELMPILTDLTRWAAEMVTKYGPSVVAVVKQIAEGFRAFVGFLSGEDEYADWFVDLVEKLPGWLQPIVGLIGQLIAGGFSFGDMLPPEALVLWESFQRLLDTMGEWWAIYGPEIMVTARELGRVLVGAFMKLVQEVLPWLAEKLDQFGAWWMDNGPLIVTFVDSVAKGIALLAMAVVNMWIVVQPLLDLLIGYIANMARLVMAIATGDWAEAWDAFGDIVFNAWEFITNTIKTAIAVLGVIIDQFLQKVFGVRLPKWLGGPGEQTGEGEGEGWGTGTAGTTRPATPAPSTLAGALPGDQPTAGPWSDWSGSGNQTNNNYNMTVNTRATTGTVQQDYHMMTARAGAR